MDEKFLSPLFLREQVQEPKIFQTFEYLLKEDALRGIQKTSDEHH